MVARALGPRRARYARRMLTAPFPLRPTAEKADPRLKGIRQFQTQPQKRGQTADNWGLKKYAHKPLFDVRASSPSCPSAPCTCGALSSVSASRTLTRMPILPLSRRAIHWAKRNRTLLPA
eukprot:COSAG02_NODE_32669_length_512_cov_1.234867_2_plen_119_part_01